MRDWILCSMILSWTHCRYTWRTRVNILGSQQQDQMIHLFHRNIKHHSILQSHLVINNKSNQVYKFTIQTTTKATKTWNTLSTVRFLHIHNKVIICRRILSWETITCYRCSSSSSNSHRDKWTCHCSGTRIRVTWINSSKTLVSIKIHKLRTTMHLINNWTCKIRISHRQSMEHNKKALVSSNHLQQEEILTNSSLSVISNQLMAKRYRVRTKWYTTIFKIMKIRVGSSSLTPLIIDKLASSNQIKFKALIYKDSSLGLAQDQEWVKTKIASRTTISFLCNQTQISSTHIARVLMKPTFRISICRMSTWLLLTVDHNKHLKSSKTMVMAFCHNQTTLFKI